MSNADFTRPGWMNRVLFVTCIALTQAACGGLTLEDKDSSSPDASLSESELREGLDEPACLSLYGTLDSEAPLSDLQPTTAVEYFAYRLIGNLIDQQTQEDILGRMEEAEAELRATGVSSEELEEMLSDHFNSWAFTFHELGDCELAQGCDRYVVPTAGSGFEDRTLFSKGHYFAWGPGGGVLITDLDQLRAFLGTIDTPLEAGLLAQHSGHSIPCDKLGGNTTPEGFVLYSEKRDHCSDDRLGQRLLVTTDGEIEVLASTVLEEGSDCVE